MFNFHKMSIRKKLVGGVVFLLIIVSAGIGIMSYLQASRALQRQVQEIIPQTANHAAGLIRGELDRYILSANEIAHNLEIRSMDRQRPVVQNMLSRFKYFQIGIVQPDGAITLNDWSRTNVKDRPYFSEAMAGRAHISDACSFTELSMSPS